MQFLVPVCLHLLCVGISTKVIIYAISGLYYNKGLNHYYNNHMNRCLLRKTPVGKHKSMLHYRTIQHRSYKRDNFWIYILLEGEGGLVATFRVKNNTCTCTSVVSSGLYIGSRPSVLIFQIVAFFIKDVVRK